MQALHGGSWAYGNPSDTQGSGRCHSTTVPERRSRVCGLALVPFFGLFPPPIGYPQVDRVEPLLYPLLRRDLMTNGPKKSVQVGDKQVDWQDAFRAGPPAPSTSGIPVPSALCAGKWTKIRSEGQVEGSRTPSPLLGIGVGPITSPPGPLPRRPCPRDFGVLNPPPGPHLPARTSQSEAAQAEPSIGKGGLGSGSSW